MIIGQNEYNQLQLMNYGNSEYICTQSNSSSIVLSSTCSSLFTVQFNPQIVDDSNCPSQSFPSYLQYSSSQYLGVNGTNVYLSNTPTTFWFTAYAGFSLYSTPSYIFTYCSNVTNNIFVSWNYQFCGNVDNNFGGITYNFYGTSFPNPPVVENEGINIPLNPTANSNVCAYISFSSGNYTCPTQVSQLQNNSIIFNDPNSNNIYCLSIMPTNSVPSCCNQYDEGIDKGHCSNSVGTCGSGTTNYQYVYITNNTQNKLMVTANAMVQAQVGGVSTFLQNIQFVIANGTTSSVCLSSDKNTESTITISNYLCYI